MNALKFEKQEACVTVYPIRSCLPTWISHRQRKNSKIVCMWRGMITWTVVKTDKLTQINNEGMRTHLKICWIFIFRLFSIIINWNPDKMLLLWYIVLERYQTRRKVRETYVQPTMEVIKDTMKVIPFRVLIAWPRWCKYDMFYARKLSFVPFVSNIKVMFCSHGWW